MRLHALDQQLVERLLRFATHEYGSGWFNELLDELDLEIDETTAPLLLPCSVYEWGSKDGTLLEVFLASSPRGLTEPDRAWLQAQRLSSLSIWEIQQVTPAVGVSVRDLFTGEERRVLEQSGSRTVGPRRCPRARRRLRRHLRLLRNAPSRTPTAGPGDRRRSASQDLGPRIEENFDIPATCEGAPRRLDPHLGADGRGP